MSGDSEDQVAAAIIGWVVKTPAALSTLFFSYISGHMWSYIIFTYIRKRKHEKGFFDNTKGRVSLGLAWHALIAVPLYLIYFGNFKISYENYIEIAYDVIIIALAIQALIFATVTIFKKGERDE